MTVVEGPDYRLVASCRSVARPAPRLTWDTDLNGQSVSRSSESGGAVSSHFSLYPLRSMNGMKLDCLVSHPSYSEPRRLQNQLVVHCEFFLQITLKMHYFMKRVKMGQWKHTHA